MGDGFKGWVLVKIRSLSPVGPLPGLLLGLGERARRLGLGFAQPGGAAKLMVAGMANNCQAGAEEGVGGGIGESRTA